MTRSKTKPERPRQAKPAYARRANVAPVGEAGQDAANAARAKAHFFAAFGHDDAYHDKCDQSVVRLRATAAGIDPAGCGWWWCKAPLSHRQLETLLEALKTLRKEGRNPNDPMVALYGALYRMHDAIPDMEALAHADASHDIAALEKSIELIGGLKVHRLKVGTLKDLRDELDRRQAGLLPSRPNKAGHPVDIATRRTLLDYQTIARWSPREIEAALILSGARRQAIREERVLRKMVRKAGEEGDHGEPIGVVVVPRPKRE